MERRTGFNAGVGRRRNNPIYIVIFFFFFFLSQRKFSDMRECTHRRSTSLSISTCLCSMSYANFYECSFRFHNDKLVLKSDFAVQALSGLSRIQYIILDILKVIISSSISQWYIVTIGIFMNILHVCKNGENYHQNITLYLRIYFLFSKGMQTFFTQKWSRFFC